MVSENIILMNFFNGRQTIIQIDSINIDINTRVIKATQDQISEAYKKLFNDFDDAIHFTPSTFDEKGKMYSITVID